MTTLTRVYITGLSGSDGVSAVTTQLKTVPGCGRMTVQVNSDEPSFVSIMSAEPMAEADLRSAVEKAGYQVDDIDVVEDALAQQMAEQAPARQAMRNPYRSSAAEPPSS